MISNVSGNGISIIQSITHFICWHLFGIYISWIKELGQQRIIFEFLYFSRIFKTAEKEKTECCLCVVEGRINMEGIWGRNFWDYGRVLYPAKGCDYSIMWIFHNPSYAKVWFVHLPVFKIHLKKRNRKQILNSKQWKKKR